MTDEEKEKYLPEDQDILKKIENIDLSIRSFEEKDSILAEAQIKALLRSRKMMADNDKSNRKFTFILAAFALLQIIIAGFQFAIEAANSADKILALFVSVLFIVSIILFTREVEKIFKNM